MLKVVEERNTDSVILTLDRGDFGPEAIFQHIRFVRENLHGFTVGEKVFQVVQDKKSNALFRIGNIVKSFTQKPDDCAEGVLLNEIEQLLFGLEVVVEPGQRHAARA